METNRKLHDEYIIFYFQTSDNQNAKFMTTGVIQLKKVEKYISLKKMI